MSFKLKFRPSSVKGKEGTLVYQIIVNREVKRVNTKFHVFDDEWDEENSAVRETGASKERDLVVKGIAETVERDHRLITYIESMFNVTGKSYTPLDVLEAFDKPENTSVLSYLESRINESRNEGGTYHAKLFATLNRLKDFLNGKDLTFKEVTPSLMRKFEKYLLDGGITPNTSSFYFRVLRGEYNKAVSYGFTTDKKPFKGIFTQMVSAEKQPLTMEEMSRICNLAIFDNANMEYARDMFMFSFYAQGMEFVDMAYISKENIEDGKLNYTRRRSGKAQTTAWLPEMQDIVDKYHTSATDYPDNLLPILTDKEKTPEAQISSVYSSIKHSLKALAKKTNIDANLTLDIARVTWNSLFASAIEAAQRYVIDQVKQN